MGWLEEAMGRYQQMQQGGSPLMYGYGYRQQMQPPQQYPGPAGQEGSYRPPISGSIDPVQPGQQNLFTPISQQLGGGQQGGFNQQAGRAPVGDFLSRFGGQFPLMDPSKFMSQFAQGQGMPFGGQRPGPMANTRPVYEQHW